MTAFHSIPSGRPRPRRVARFLALAVGLGLAIATLRAAETAPATTSPPPVAPEIAAPGTNRVSGAASATNAPTATEAPAAEPATAATDYKAFRLVTERNIFNANRSGRSSRPRGEARRQPRVDTFGLVGTMRYAKGPLAFFDGSSSDFRKALQPGGTVAGYTVRRIETDEVQLAAGDKTLTLKVGSQLRREDDGEWKVSETRETFASVPTGSGGSGSSSSSGSTGSGTSGAGEVSDVLKRLMQQREQELK